MKQIFLRKPFIVIKDILTMNENEIWLVKMWDNEPRDGRIQLYTNETDALQAKQTWRQAGWKHIEVKHFSSLLDTSYREIWLLKVWHAGDSPKDENVFLFESRKEATEARKYWKDAGWDKAQLIKFNFGWNGWIQNKSLLFE